MSLQPHLLGPFSGIDARRTDDRAVQPGSMRGGFNVMAIDGEWWTRGGTVGDASPIALYDGGIPNVAVDPEWLHIFRYTDSPRIFWISPYLVAYSIGGKFSIPYATKKANESVAYVNGSQKVTTSTVAVVGDLMVDAQTGTIYQVTIVVGTQATLHRPVVGTTGARSTKFYDPINAGAIGASGSVGFSGYAIFRQNVTHGAGAVWAGSPAVTAGDTYLVVTSDQQDPYAIKVTGTAVAPLIDIFRDTSQVTPPSKGSAFYCSTFKDRLILGVASDANGANALRTIWYSQAFDLLQWHTGVVTINAIPNYITFSEGLDSISALGQIEDILVVHRHYSQMLISFTGSGIAPFSLRRNSQGIGVAVGLGASVITANANHFFLSESGAALFDGNTVSLLDANGQALVQNLSGLGINVACGVHEPRNNLLMWASGKFTQEVGAPVGGSTVLCYNYRTQVWWLMNLSRSDIETGADGVSAMGYDDSGNILIGWSAGPGSSWQPIDGTVFEGNAGLGGPDPDPRLTCRAETPWISFGDEFVKTIERMEFELRSFSYGAGAGPQFTYSLTCDIYADYQGVTPKATADVTYVEDDFISPQSLGMPIKIRKQVPIRASGRVLKFVFHNTPVNASDLKPAMPFRLSQVIVWADHGESRKSTA